MFLEFTVQLIKSKSTKVNAFIFHRFPSELFENHAEVPEEVQCCLAACHSASKIGGKMIGDPLDVKMFQFTRWVFYSFM